MKVTNRKEYPSLQGPESEWLLYYHGAFRHVRIQPRVHVEGYRYLYVVFTGKFPATTTLDIRNPQSMKWRRVSKVKRTSDMPEPVERNRSRYISILINGGMAFHKAIRTFELANKRLWQSLAIIGIALMITACDHQSPNAVVDTFPEMVQLGDDQDPMELSDAVDTILRRQTAILDVLVDTSAITNEDALSVVEIGASGESMRLVTAVQKIHERQDKIVGILIERRIIQNTEEGHEYLRRIYEDTND
jgi:hypothetical protein